MRSEIKIALIYLVTGIIWILASDAIVATLFGQTHGLLVFIQTNKGMAFVIVTSVLIYALVRADVLERQRQETKFQLLFAKNPNPMWVYDATTLRFLEVNNRALETYGYTREEFLQMTIKDIRPAKDVIKLLNVLSQPRTAAFRSMEWQHQTRTGEILNVEITSQQIEYEGRLATLVVAHDITERKELQAERSINESLKMALEREHEAYATRSRFFSMVSHDFRTPLATITSSASFLQKYDDGRLDTDRRKEYYQRIVKQAYHLSDQLDEMLLILRTEMAASNYQPQPHDIVAMCQEIVQNMETPDGKARLIEFESRHDMLVIDMDVKLMWRVLTNLVSNAIKYSDEDKPVHISLDTPDNRVEICVQDEGIGIPQDEVDRLFEPFFRANNVNDIKGTGLGLTIVKQAVELHGGRITVKSVEGEGTMFYIILPLSQPYIVELE